MISLESLQSQINIIREKQSDRDRSLAVLETRLDTIQKSVDNLAVNASRVVWAILLGVVGAVLNMVLR